MLTPLLKSKYPNGNKYPRYGYVRDYVVQLLTNKYRYYEKEVGQSNTTFAHTCKGDITIQSRRVFTTDNQLIQNTYTLLGREKLNIPIEKFRHDYYMHVQSVGTENEKMSFNSHGDE